MPFRILAMRTRLGQCSSVYCPHKDPLFERLVSLNILSRRSGHLVYEKVTLLAYLEAIGSFWGMMNNDS